MSEEDDIFRKPPMPGGSTSKKKWISSDSESEEENIRTGSNLTEDESSDEEIKVDFKVKCPLTPEIVPSLNKISEISHSETTYDFSNILKSQQIKVEAGKGNIGVGAKQLESIEHNPSSVSKGPSNSDKCYVEELLLKGEKNIYDKEVPDSKEQNEVIQSFKIAVSDPTKEKDSEKHRKSALTRNLIQARNELQVEIHKVNLLCLIAHGNYVSSLINNDLLYGCALSFLPPEYSPPPLVTVSYIQRLLKWFGKKFPVLKMKKSETLSLSKLEEIFRTFQPSSIRDSVILFVSLLRGLSLTVRIVINLNPVPLKIKNILKTPEVSPRKAKNITDPEVNLNLKVEKDSKILESYKSGHSSKKTDAKNKSLDVRSSAKAKANVSSKKSLSEPKRRNSESGSSGKKTNLVSVGSVSPKPGPSKKHTKANKKSSKVGEEETETSGKCVVNYWAEVYIENEERWLPVDLYSLKIDCDRELANRCSQPLGYILGWKNDGSLKDVTLRYASSWSTKKYRIDQEWWKQTLFPFLSRNRELDIIEDRCLNEIWKTAPMPTTINEFKNHPLYVLPRHLLKNEAIYPQDAAPLGYVRGEPIFSRYCVYTLRSRQKWLQEGKAVKLGEEPYKMVNKRAKFGKLAKTNFDLDQKSVDLFGSWQVVDYVPPPAVDGHVPKNEYGNVELYKSSMLPAGTVHLPVPGLIKIAQKLGIDCAPAVVGWQHHNGVSHPDIDGVVVCKEYQEILMDAWSSEVDQADMRYIMKRRLRAKKNWIKLCKSLIIKQRLKKKFGFFDSSSTQDLEEDDEPVPKLSKK